MSSFPCPYLTCERVFTVHKRLIDHTYDEHDARTFMVADISKESRIKRKPHKSSLVPIASLLSEKPEVITIAKPRHPQKLLTQDQILRNRLLGIRGRAAKKGVLFALTVEDIAKVISSNCVYCNAPPRSELDRKVPKDGYVVENIVPACHRCNTLKSNVITYEEMLKVADILGWRV